MTKISNPFDIWMLNVAAWKMAVEAQSVITYRMLGMAGVLAVAPGENARMMAEKQKAFVQSSIAASTAIVAGKSAANVMSDALSPIARKTSANSKRLRRRGSKKSK